MIKGSNIFKVILGLVVAMFVMIGVSSNAYAEQVTKRANDMPEALALLQELQTTGITFDLTIESTSESILNYLKGEMTRIPVATIYNPVQFKLTGGNSTTYPIYNQGSCSNNTNTNQNNTGNVSCPSQNNGNTNSTNQSNTGNVSCPSQNNGNTNSTNQNNVGNTNCPNQSIGNNDSTVGANTTTKTNTQKEETTQKDKDENDASPKTGDTSPIKVVGIVLVVSAVLMIGLVIFKKKRA